VREPRWVERLVVDAIHLDQIREHGGFAGIRDENALEAALARPRQKWHYEPKADLATLAAAYGFGLSRSHPFRDGNKRVAFIVMVVFLELNAWSFDAEETEVVSAMVALAEGSLGEKDLTKWVKQHSRKRKGGRAV
jgi:death-on-curing protein